MYVIYNTIVFVLYFVMPCLGHQGGLVADLNRHLLKIDYYNIITIEK